MQMINALMRGIKQQLFVRNVDKNFRVTFQADVLAEIYDCLVNISLIRMHEISPTPYREDPLAKLFPSNEPASRL